MALQSMTGFGRGVAAAGGIHVEVELSSVNRRQLDIRIALPRSLAALEGRMHGLLQDALSRGHVTGSVKVDVTGSACAGLVSVNMDIARASVDALRRAGRELGLKDDLGVRALLQLPDVIGYDSVPRDIDRMWELVQRALKKALRELLRMRSVEGESLAQDLAKRFKRLGSDVAAIQRRAPAVLKRYRQQLRDRLQEVGFDAKPDDPSLQRELALFADRCDISEELVRLQSHLEQVDVLFRKKEPVGRTLDFLCQEMFREINTIGSKANDAQISQRAVQFKASLERVREQVQNIE